METSKTSGKSSGSTVASDTSRALEEAMKAMEAKEQARGKRFTRLSTQSAAYELGAKKASHSAAAEETAPIWKRQLTPREWKIGGGIAAAIVLLLVGWAVLVPSAEQDVQAAAIKQLKVEGDGLLAEGKLAKAYQKYDQIFLMSAGRKYSGAAGAAVAAASKARVEIRQEHPALFAKATLAKSGG